MPPKRRATRASSVSSTQQKKRKRTTEKDTENKIIDQHPTTCPTSIVETDLYESPDIQPGEALNVLSNKYVRKNDEPSEGGTTKMNDPSLKLNAELLYENQANVMVQRRERKEACSSEDDENEAPRGGDEDEENEDPTGGDEDEKNEAQTDDNGDQRNKQPKTNTLNIRTTNTTSCNQTNIIRHTTLPQSIINLTNHNANLYEQEDDDKTNQSEPTITDPFEFDFTNIEIKRKLRPPIIHQHH